MNIANFLHRVESTFPFDQPEMCFEVSNISKKLMDIEIKAFKLPDDFELKPLYPSFEDDDKFRQIKPDNEHLFTAFSVFRDYIKDVDTDSVYHLDFNTTEWAMLFHELEARGFTAVFYTLESLAEIYEDSFDGEAPFTDDKWRENTKLVIFVDSSF